MVVPPNHPKIIIFSGKTHGFVGYHHFRKPPYLHLSTYQYMNGRILRGKSRGNILMKLNPVRDSIKKVGWAIKQIFTKIGTRKKVLHGHAWTHSAAKLPWEKHGCRKMWSFLSRFFYPATIKQQQSAKEVAKILKGIHHNENYSWPSFFLSNQDHPTRW